MGSDIRPYRMSAFLLTARPTGLIWEMWFHSCADDRLALPRHTGAISIVVANFATDWDGDLREVSVNCHLGEGVWNELSPGGRIQAVRGALMGFRDENIRFAGQFGIPHEVFNTSVITVELRDDAAVLPGNVAGFLLAVNLLSRTFATVHAVFPAEAVVHSHPWHLKTVGAVVDELVQSVDGSLYVGLPKRSDVVLSIGEGPYTSAEREVVVRGSHWCGALDCDLPGTG